MYILSYSNLTDSIGSNWAALHAGYIPKLIPIAEHTISPINTQSMGITVGILNKIETILPPETPRIMPTIPPN